MPTGKPLSADEESTILDMLIAKVPRAQICKACEVAPRTLAKICARNKKLLKKEGAAPKRGRPPKEEG